MDTFSKLCTSHYFVVPENQRGFSWGKQHVDDLINDLSLAGDHSHYMGPVIVTRSDPPVIIRDDHQNNIVEYTLEDGQQRITTLFIIANEIRKRMEELKAGATLDSQELERLVFFTKDGVKRLRLDNRNVALWQYYAYTIAGQPLPPAAVTPPMVAMKSVADHARDFFSSQSYDELLVWSGRIKNQAKFIWVDLGSEGINRYLAFDAINSRGLPLSEFDKIKNFCILISSVRTLNLAVDTAWYSAITQLQAFRVGQRQDEAAFISDLYSVFHDDIVSQGSVHTAFVSRYRKLLIQSDPLLEKDLVNFVGLWEEYAKSFGFITSSQRSNYYDELCTDRAGIWLDRLSYMDLPTITRSLLTACHIRMDEAAFERVARAGEIYTFRVHAAGPYRKDKNRPQLNKLANEVLRINKDADYVLSRLCGWLTSLAPMKDFLLGLADGRPKYGHWSHTYYFLYEYELHHSPAGVSPLPWQASHQDKVNSQEHILPQTHRDSSWWESHWPNEVEAEKYKHRLGNLVLTPDNRALHRKPFPLKLQNESGTHSYTAPKATNSEKRIVKFTNGVEWRPANILARELDLLHFAAERWSLPCCGDNGTIDLPDEFGPAAGGHAYIAIQKEACYSDIGESDPGLEGASSADDNDGEFGIDELMASV